MEITRSNISQMERQLTKWGAKLDDLAAEAEQAGAEASNDYHEMIAELKTKHLTAAGKLHELRDSREDQWDNHRTGAERAWLALEAAIDGLAS